MSRTKSRMADDVEWVVRLDDNAPRFYGGPLGAWRSKHIEVMLSGPYETGKDQPVTATVYTPDGPKAMGVIKVGDLVLAGDGSPTVVTGVFPQGSRPVYRVTMDDGAEVMAGEDHLWLVGKRSFSRLSVTDDPGRKRIKGSGYDDWRVMTTRELAGKNLTKKAGSKKETRRKYWLPLAGAAQFTRRRLPVDPYVMGILISEGGLTGSSVVFSTGDDEVVAEVCRRVTDARIKHRDRVTYAIVGAEGNSYVDRLEGLGLMGRRSDDKFIPGDYLYSDIADRIALLRGLMDGDGTIDTKGHVTYTSVSRQLIDDLTLLVESLGGRVSRVGEKPGSYTKDGRRIYTGATGYTAHISLPVGFNPFHLSRKAARVSVQSDPRRFIDRIEYVGEMPTQCISVAHPSHLYLTDHFLVTHNTFAALNKLHTLMLKYPGSRGLMTRKLYSSLTNTALITYYYKVLPYPPSHPLCPVVVFGGGRPETITYPNGSQITVAGLDNADKVLSGEYDFVYVNQAEELGLHDWEQLLSRTTGRAGNAPYSQMLGDCNPGAPNHWILNRPSLELFKAEHQDNPTLYDHEREEWTEQGRRTLSILSTLTGLRYKRGFLGMWAGAEGQIYESFDESVHVIDPFPIPTNWRRYRVIDFGYTHPFVCYDDQTEVLSEDGWVKFDDLRRGVRVATVKDGVGQMEYQLPTSYIKQRYAGPMVQSTAGRLGVDFCVTPNHKMIVQSRKTGKVKKVDAAELFTLGSNWSIPVGWKPFEGYSDDDPGAAIAKFIGLFVAEGYLNRTSHSVRIAQKDHIGAVRDTLVAAGLPFSEYKSKSGVAEFSIGKRKVYDYLLSLLGSEKSGEKRLPRECFEWSIGSRIALLSGLILGDGRKNCYDGDNHIQSSIAYYTTSRGLADDVQELGATLGLATKLGQGNSVSSFDGKEKTTHVVRFNQFDMSNVGRANLSVVAYDGYVHCVEVPNGTLVVRRNGRPMVCGNCQWWAQDHRGTLYMYREIYHTGRIIDEHVNGTGGDPGIAEISGYEQYEATICDHDAEDRATLEKHGIKTIKADKSIRQGIEAVQMRLRINADGNSGMYFFRDALLKEDDSLKLRYKPLRTTDEFGGYAWPSMDTRRREASPRDEFPVRADDHGLDCLRYLVMRVDGRPTSSKAQLSAYA